MLTVVQHAVFCFSTGTMSLFMRYFGTRGSIHLQTFRTLSTSRIECDKPVVASESKRTEDPLQILKDGKNHKPDNLEKRFLVWSGKYKSIQDVPPTVPQETMEKARNKARIKIANYMIIGTIVACVGFIYSGKQAAKRGESVQKMNLDWHKQVSESTKE